ncbi:MAG: hypothetical protein PHT54_03010 [Candidatus Nanoarchaeia archaeon]|nr:hypothetical protein [Candidatus Nanoarchaeia archaeon]
MREINILGTKSGILDPKHLKSYTPTVDIINAVDKKDWFRALWYSFAQLEFYLRRHVLWYVTNYSKAPEAEIFDEIMNKTEFWKIIEKAEKIKLITKDEQKEIDYVRNVRNDMAHSFYLVYNQNINEREARVVIEFVLKVINKLNKKAEEFKSIMK